MDILECSGFVWQSGRLPWTDLNTAATKGHSIIVRKFRLLISVYIHTYSRYRSDFLQVGNYGLKQSLANTLFEWHVWLIMVIMKIIKLMTPYSLYGSGPSEKSILDVPRWCIFVVWFGMFYVQGIYWRPQEKLIKVRNIKCLTINW